MAAAQAQRRAALPRRLVLAVAALHETAAPPPGAALAGPHMRDGELPPADCPSHLRAR